MAFGWHESKLSGLGDVNWGEFFAALTSIPLSAQKAAWHQMLLASCDGFSNLNAGHWFW